MWPFDKKSLSRFSQSGFLGSWFIMAKYKAVNISAIPRGPAEWPLPATRSILIISLRISLAFISSSSSVIFFIAERVVPLCEYALEQLVIFRSFVLIYMLLGENLRFDRLLDPRDEYACVSQKSL